MLVGSFNVVFVSCPLSLVPCPLSLISCPLSLVSFLAYVKGLPCTQSTVHVCLSTSTTPVLVLVQYEYTRVRTTTAPVNEEVQ